MNIKDIQFEGLDQLLALYRIFSPSLWEGKMSMYVKSVLKSEGITFKTEGKAIYNFIPNTPLICAHMDEVSDRPKGKIRVRFDKKHKGMKAYRTRGAIGGDDKNGVWILLQILTNPEFKNKVSFIFSVEEEIGGMTHKILQKESEAAKSILYGLVFDRRGNSDMIGIHKYNCYCEDDMWDALAEARATHGYQEARGVFCDAEDLSNHFACVNISCGYYKPHTNYDYTILKDLKKSLDLGIDILRTVKPDKPFKVAYNEWSDYYDWRKTSAKDSESKGFFYKDGKWYELGADTELQLLHSAADDDDLEELWTPRCPLCGTDMIVDSCYPIGDNLCMKCGCVYDDDCTVQFVEDWNEGYTRKYNEDYKSIKGDMLNDEPF